MTKTVFTLMYRITLPLILVAVLGALLWKFLPVSRPAYQGMSSGISSDLQADTASKIWITAGLVSASGHRDEAGRPANVLDEHPQTSWCGNAGEWINLNLDALYLVESVNIRVAPGQHPITTENVELLVSPDSLEWSPAAIQSITEAGGKRRFRFSETAARHVRLSMKPGLAGTLCFSAIEVWGRPEGFVDVVSDWETGNLRQWHGIRVRDTALQFRTVTNPVRQGRFAAEFIVRPGDTVAGITGERSEAAHYNDTWNGYSQETLNDEYYYGWSTLIPEDWTNPQEFGIFMQWHARTPLNPPIAFNIENDSIGVNFRSGVTGGRKGRYTYSYNRYHIILRDLHKGKWQDFIVRVRFRPDTTGIFEVWHRIEGQERFTQLLSLHNIPTLQYATDLTYIDAGAELQFGDGYTSSCYVQQGLYRGKGGNNTNRIYHDNWARGSTYAAIRARFR